MKVRILLNSLALLAFVGPSLVGAQGLLLSEVLYDITGSDDGYEWVELFNPGSQPVNLSGYSLGCGGSDYTYSKVQLSGTIQPGATFVVGGPNRNSSNGFPSYNKQIDFDPDIQNSGDAADGVALFDRPTSQVNSSTRPIDAVIYGPTNSNGLIDETGVAKAPEVGDASPNSSIERTSLSGSWRTRSSPSPNSTSLTPANSAPSVAINSPSTGSSFSQGQSINFRGAASDSENGNLTSSISWSSNRDGTFGSGGNFNYGSLSTGTHSITARVTDSGGLADADSIIISISEEVNCAFVYWIEIAAASSGEGNSQWRTDLSSRNTGVSSATVEYTFHSVLTRSLSSSLSPGAQGSFEDIVGLMGAEGVGTIEICSSQPLKSVARIYNLSGSGTFGQSFRSYASDEGLVLGQVADLLGLRQLEGQYRTNISVTNTGSATAVANVRLFDAAGIQLHSYNISVSPNGVVQDAQPFASRANRPNLGWGYATVTVISGSGVLTSASVIDERTGDATTILMIK